MVMVRTNLTLPVELLEQIDRVAGPRGRSSYIASVVAKQVRRDLQRKVFEETLRGDDRQARLDEPRRGARIRQGAAGELGPAGMKYVLDTTLLIDVAHGVPAARTVFAALFEEPNDLYTCDVVTAEALSGGTDEQRVTSGGFSTPSNTSQPPPTPLATRPKRVGDVARRATARSGDALIGGVAWFLDATVITRNPDDFIAQGIPVLTY